MKKIFISLTVMLSITCCKGPGSGPLVRESFDKEEKNQNMQAQPHKNPVSTVKINVVVEPCNDCVTIAKLLANKESYSGKVIKIKGNVTKFNPAIMGKNWVHIQDGSEFQGGFDLTVTTDIKTSVGETLTFEGKIVLDKDFGYGYSYNVLMENGKAVL